MPVLLLSPPAWALTIVEGSDPPLNIDSSSVRDSYFVNSGGQLNVNGAVTDDILVDNGSNVNVIAGSVSGGGNNGIEVTNSTASLSANASISSDFIGLVLNKQIGVAGGSSATATDSLFSGAVSAILITGPSRLDLINSTLNGTGQSSSGMLIQGGTVKVSAGSITGGRNGITLGRDPVNEQDSSLVLSGTQVIGKTGPALAVTSGPTDIVLEGGASLNGGNGNILDVAGASNVAMRVGQSTLAGNVQARANSTANLTFDQGRMTGDFTVEPGSTGNLVLDNGSVLNGNLSNLNSVAINRQSQWNMSADNTVASLAMDGGQVRFGEPQAFHRLDVGNLSGNGFLLMDVDFATNQHDVLNVSGNASGNFDLLIAGSGVDPLDPQRLNVVNTAAGDARFALAGGVVDVGTWSYGLSSATDASGATGWYLDPSKKTVSPGTRSVLALFNTAPTVWYGELTSLRSRMGELRFNGGKAGGWARTYGNKYDVADASGVGYQQTQRGFSLGADAPLPIGDGQWLVGIMAGYSKSDLDLNRGTSGTVKSYYLGSYATWLDQGSGYYFDAVIKFNRFYNDARVGMSDGVRSKGDYDTPGAGGSVEFGRHIKLDDGYFVEPFTQLSGVVIQGRDYDLNNGMQAEGDRTRSLLGKLGMTAGRNFTLHSGAVMQPYVRVAGAHEFAKNNEVQVNNNVFNNDLSGSRGELGAGLAVAFSESLQVHADFDYAKGENIEQPFGANVGLRYSW
ncbi:Autotransporter [Pseudomonas cichorii]|uniref:Autotransporter n=1 Tax=Pseudomonas cichorii TaxID=36746 RepID=A0A3M4M6K6_PSECI|nr:Autotransporter [Pseudomonas cichorii]